MSVVLIDENKLDRECVRLPSDYLKFANLAADKKRDAEEIKNEIEVLEADLAKRIRDTPGKFGLEKVTEGAIKEIIQSHPQTKEKVKQLLDAAHAAALAQNIVWALEAKKKTLTLLVELHGMGYFANPKVSDRGREAVNDMSRRAGRPGRSRPLSREDE